MLVIHRYVHRLSVLLGVLMLVACGGSPPPPPPTSVPTVASEPTAGATAPMEPDSPTSMVMPDSPTSMAMPDSPTSAAVEPMPMELGQRTGLLVNLATDDTWSANMALNLAMKARDQGLEPVIVFLNVHGVYLADSERMPAQEGNSDINIHQRIEAFIAAGGRVIACPSCSGEAGLTQANYIEGVVVGEPGGVIPILSDPSMAVISYPARHTP